MDTVVKSIPGLKERKKLAKGLVAIVALLGAVAMSALFPAVSAAEALVGPAPAAGAAGAAGLPDGRVYEQVSPVDKNGNFAGAERDEFAEGGERPTYALARAGGSGEEAGILYGTTGPSSSTASSGLDPFSVSVRSAAGWETKSVLPLGDGQSESPFAFLEYLPQYLLPSSDLMRTAFVSRGGNEAFGSYGPGPLGNEAEHVLSRAYLTNVDGSVTWLGAPTPGSPLVGRALTDLSVIGGSPSLGTVYFSYDGTLVAADAPRALALAAGNPTSVGLYEWRDGALSSAGILPSGQADPYGAIPIAQTQTAGARVADFSNHTVSRDGSRLFFMSPDPEACRESGEACEEHMTTPELYVRETAGDGTRATVLISRSAVTNLPAAHPPLVGAGGAGIAPAYAYASPDGSRVFFEDIDPLTADAPSGLTVKEYEFNTATNVLSYLAGVADEPARETETHRIEAFVSPILMSSEDGSRLLFAKQTSGGVELDVWADGRLTRITRLPEPAGVLSPRSTRDGSVFVFATSSAIAGFNNAGEHEEIYRYVVSSNELSCVSCPPAGAAATGDAAMSNGGRRAPSEGNGIIDSRGLAEDGGRMLFDSPTALVPGALNGRRNVYEWEDEGGGTCPTGDRGGCLYLVSSGSSGDPSFAMDMSASGEDIFFSTAEALVPGDSDGSYDVYDARVGGGFPQAAPMSPCSGDACQGSQPSAPPMFGLPASQSFTGTGNLTAPPSKSATKAHKLKKKHPKHKTRRGSKGKHSSKGRARNIDRRAKARTKR